MGTETCGHSSPSRGLDQRICIFANAQLRTEDAVSIRLVESALGGSRWESLRASGPVPFRPTLFRAHRDCDI